MKKLLLLFCLLGPLIGIVPRESYADIAANAGRDVYTGNASTTAFTGTFKILTSANVSVYLDGVLKVLTTHYTLSGVGNDGGFTVTFTSAPANGVQVLLLRNQPIEQTSTYIPGSISAATIERDFDRQVAIAQQQQEQLNRSFKFNATITPSPPTLVQLPSPAASKCWAWNSGGTAVEYVTCGSGGGGGGSPTVPASPSGSVQFNNSGVFGGDAGLVYDPVANILGVGGDVQVAGSSVCLENGTNCPAGSSGTAAGTTFTPAGNIAATNVQTAIQELDTEKQATDTDLDCIAALGGTGYVTRTGSGTCAARKINGTAEQIAVANDDGVSANPTLSIPSPLTLPGILQLSNVSPAQVTADQNNYAGCAGAISCRVSTDTARTITGIVAPTGFRLLFVFNIGAQNLLIAHESASSTAANRISTVRVGTLTIPGGSWALFIYDVTTARWRAVDLAPTTVAEADTLATVTARGKTTAECISFVGGCRFTDSSGDGVVIYRSAGTGPVVTCVIAGVENDCDHIETLNTGKKKEIRDPSGNPIWATSAAGVTTYGAGYHPTGQINWDAGAINVDGTNCAVPTEQALNSAEKTWAFSCADSNSSIFSGKIKMPANYDGSTITFTLSLFHGTTEGITFAGDFSAQCRAAGTAINSTYGTAVAADVSITTANQIAEATTAAVTPNGTCTTPGPWLQWRYVVDAANFSANAANSKVLGVTMHYGKNALSQ